MSLLPGLFPLWALLAAGLAWIFPQLFASWNAAIVPLLTLVMFGMGMTLTFANFKRVLQYPLKLGVGTGLQFFLMPLLAFLLARLFSLQNELLVGLVLVGCCPGGTASNVVCYLAKGDVALSISLTMISTLLSVLMTPLLTWIYIGQSIDVPILSMMLGILQMVIVPVLLGVVINSCWGSELKKIAPVFPVVSVAAIVVIIGIVVGLNRDNFPLAGIMIFVAVILHNLLGIATAYGTCKALKYDEPACRTIAIEVGMQNSGLAVALASQFFSSAAALPGAVFSLWHNLSGSLLAGWWSRSDS